MVKTRVGYEANPNGNLWLKDTAGFGQKMLAKMGWKEGQGLGRQEQGIKQAIRVSRKRDNRGVGCSRQWAEEGSAQMDAFAAVLADLNRQHGASPAQEEAASPEEPLGLEESSRRSRHRLHYAKFTRGKDLSACSDQDLRCIIGPRGLPGEKIEEEAAEEENTPESNSLGLRQVQSSLSTAEYFQQKMEAMRARLQASASAPDLRERREEEEADKEEQDEEEEVSPERPSFRLGGDVSDGLEDGELSHQSLVASPAPAAIQEDDAEEKRLERRRRKEERRRLRRERRRTAEEAEENVEREDLRAEDEDREERRRRKEERRRLRQERRAAEEEEERMRRDVEDEDIYAESERAVRKERKNEKDEEEKAAPTSENGDDEGSKKKKRDSKKGEEEVAPLSENNEEDTSRTKERRRKKKKKRREQSSESEGEAAPKRRRTRPASAPMTKQEASEFAASNQEIMQQLEWSAFSTSNLGSVVGYKYAKIPPPQLSPW